MVLLAILLLFIIVPVVEIWLILEVAELLGGSMAAAQQLEAARQRAEVIALLADVSRAMLAEDELDAMLQRLDDELHRCFQLSLSTLCLRDDGAVLRASGHDLEELGRMRC